MHWMTGRRREARLVGVPSPKIFCRLAFGLRFAAQAANVFLDRHL